MWNKELLIKVAPFKQRISLPLFQQINVSLIIHDNNNNCELQHLQTVAHVTSSSICPGIMSLFSSDKSVWPTTPSLWLIDFHSLLSNSGRLKSQNLITLVKGKQKGGPNRAEKSLWMSKKKKNYDYFFFLVNYYYWEIILFPNNFFISC